MRAKVLIFLYVLFISLGFVFRVYQLANRPLGFTWDEAALGYNAYSLLLTGRDEHGDVLPLIFKSFGDYKPGLYVYFTVATVKLFGLNEFSTRLPSAVFGTLSVALIYILVRRIFDRRSALLSTLLLSINPWSVHFSRAAWEANVALSITLLATILFLRRRYTLSMIFFAFTLLTYQGAKLFTPVLIIFLILSVWRQFTWRQFIIPALLFIAIIFPVLISLNSSSGRLKVFSVFSYSRSTETIQTISDQEGTNKSPLIYLLFHSENIDRFRGILLRYLNHFSLRFLFFEGDWSNARQSTPYIGYYYLPELLTIIMGILLLIRKPNKSKYLILFWLVIAPIPAAFSRDIISAVRSLPLSIPLCIISAVGLSELSKKKFIFPIFLGLLFYFSYYFADLYFIHSPYFTTSSWLYPYKPVLQQVAKYSSNYSKIVFSDVLGQPYIFTLFYLKWDPRDFQSNSKFVDSSVGDVGYLPKFNKFEFRPIYWPDDRGRSNTMFVGDDFQLPDKDLQTTEGIVRIADIKLPDARPSWHVVGLP